MVHVTMNVHFTLSSNFRRLCLYKNTFLLMGQCPCSKSRKVQINFNRKYGNMPNQSNMPNRPKLHDRPIIGIMAVVTQHSHGDYALPAGYVKNVEMSGARVVPVLPGQSESYYRKMFEKLNGLFIPGGWGAPTTNQKSTTEAVQLFYRWSIEAFDQAEKSDYFPIWGTCLGMETLLDITEGMSGTLLTRCDMANKSFPLTLTNEGKETRLISSLPDDLLTAIQENPVIPHLHSFCITVDEFNKRRLNEFYTLVGTNRDKNGLLYVSAIEARNYPMFALMGHPEKTLHSWTRAFDYDRSLISIRMAQHLVNFFVQECCKNDHHFANPKEELEALIYNYQPIYTAKETPGSISDQCYYFS